MNPKFPTLGFLNGGRESKALAFSASRLGINVEIFLGDTRDSLQLNEFVDRCDLITSTGQEISSSLLRNLMAQGHTVRPSPELENFGDPREADVHVLVARSPHGQAATWSPMEIFQYRGGVILSNVTSDAHLFQRIALDEALKINLVGVALVGLKHDGPGYLIDSFHIGSTPWGSWSIWGTETDQYEQHIRALFDLPLGDTKLISPCVVVGFFTGEPEANLFRPYLHLMARNPELKFEQYGIEVDGFQGSVMVHGKSLLDLRLTIEHALDFMNGVIDE